MNWGSIEASDDGDFKRLPAGPYVVKVVGIEDFPSREYVEVVFDIAEGEHAGFFDDDFGRSHPYTHHLFLSYKEAAQSMLKGRLEKIQESNSGFDPFAAWDADRLDMFVGRVFGANIQDEEYEKSDGTVGVRQSVCQIVVADKVRRGEVTAKPKKLLERGARPTITTSAGTRDIDVPFD